MAKVFLEERYLEQLSEIDAEIAILNRRKIITLFEALQIKLEAKNLEDVLNWTLIVLTVPDRGMARQLNALVMYVPNLKFIYGEGESIFTLSPGTKGRRIWKER